MDLTASGLDYAAVGTPRSPSALLLALCLFAPAATRAAEAPWLEVSSPHFAVVTNAGEKSGRRIAWQFEQVRAVVARLWPWAKVESGKPVVVLAVRDEKSLRALAPRYWEGDGYRPTAVFVSGRDRHYALLRTDVRDSDDVGHNPYFTAYEAYLFLALDQVFPSDATPLWFERGLAQVLASAIVTDDEIQVGRPIHWKLETLRENPRLTIPDLVRVDRRSPYYTQELQARVFDAQSWAFVHYLMYAEKRKHAPAFNRFAGLVSQGRPGEDAFRETLGDPAAFAGPFSTHVERGLWSYARYEIELAFKPEAFSSRPLSPAESAAVRAGVHVAMARPNEARMLADEARRDPQLPLPWEVDAMLLDADGKRDEARAAFAKAVEKGSRNFYVHYRLAQLEWTPGNDRAQLEARVARLRTALELNPDSSYTHSFLGETLAALGQTEEGLPLAQRAVELDPREPYHRLALGRALWAARRPDEAAAAARTALRLSDSDAERRQAQELLDYLSRQPATPPAAPDAQTQAACFEAGQADACSRLAPMLRETCDQQPATPAAAWACSGLGWLHENGHGVTKDVAQAAELYGRACAAGERPACVGRATLLASGPDAAKGAAELEALCEAGDAASACTSLAVLHARKQTGKDLARARELLEKGCKAGDEDACRLLKSLPK